MLTGKVPLIRPVETSGECCTRKAVETTATEELNYGDAHSGLASADRKMGSIGDKDFLVRGEWGLSRWLL